MNDPVAFTWECPTCSELNNGDALYRPRYQCGCCGDWHLIEDIHNFEYWYDEDAERADAEENGTPDYDDLGFLRGYTPPSDPNDV